MSNLKKENAHSNINDLIVANTIQEIAHASKGNYTEQLFIGKTRGDKPRYIHTQEPMLGSESNRNWLTDMLRMKIEDNPAYSDTTKASDVQNVLKRMQELEQPSMLTRGVDRIKSYISNLLK